MSIYELGLVCVCWDASVDAVKLDKFTLKNELDNSVFRDDVEMIYALLKYHNVKVSPVLLKSAVKKGKLLKISIIRFDP
jgi:hypothetical protein